MKTLAIDSSLAVGSVAALFNGVVAEERLPVAGEHARRLAAAIDALATGLGWSPRATEVVAVVRGPGSFTGLRVGVATAKAIAWATGATLIGVSGFELIARASARQTGRADADVHVAYDAGRGEVFVATCSPAADVAGGWRVGEPRILAAGDWLASLPRGAVVSGPGLEIVGGGLAARSDLVVAQRAAWLPTAAKAGALALELVAAGRADDPHSLVPDYLRPSYAHETAARSFG
jgi:tRNA threonylcarbamoyladenosine biosynthesis protein TsaB